MFKKLKNMMGDTYSPVSKNEIIHLENVLKLKLPPEMTQMYNDTGCGMLSFENDDRYYSNDNRIICPDDIVGIYTDDQDILQLYDLEGYKDFADNWKIQLIFFVISDDTYFSIGISKQNFGQIFDNDVKIADSLYDFFNKMIQNPYFYEKLY